MKYAAIPKFGQYVEYITQAPEVDGFCDVIINQVDLSEQPIIEAAETIKADYEKVSTLDRLPEPLTEEKLIVVKDKVTIAYCEDVAAYVTQTAEVIPLLTNVIEVKSYPDWKVGEVVQVGWVRLYRPNGNLYKVIQAHTTQADWTPTVAFTLWNRFFAPDDPQVNYWVAWYAYKVGDEVIYEPNGLKYRCLQAHTSQPDWTPPAVPALWQQI